MIDTPCPAVSSETAEAFGAEMDAIRTRVRGELGARDAAYLRRVVRVQRLAALSGRGLLFFGLFPPAWLAGTALLSLAKILDNMEIGHNVMHGQYDFMRDPAYDSRTFEWDNACPSAQWKHSHNVVHHTFTNVIGKDRDVGYGLLRMAEAQPWAPRYLPQPLYALALALGFQWGVALYDVELERVPRGEKPWPEARALLVGVAKKGGRQVLKDYLLWPLLAGPFFLPVLLGNLTANLARNVWAFSVIFCGHFPDGAVVFDERSLAGETRGQWYVRQLLGSANITGGRLLHVLTGNLSHQIEHHLFPDLPAHRYAEIAPEVRAACARHGLPYHSGSMTRQLARVVRKIVRLSLPTRRRGPAAPAAPGTVEASAPALRAA